MNALYIITSEKVNYSHIINILRSIILYKKIIIVINNKSSEVCEKVFNKIKKILNILNIPVEKSIIVKYENDLKEVDKFLEYIKQEIGISPKILVSDDPKIYSLFFGKLLIDHIDTLENRIKEMVEKDEN